MLHTTTEDNIIVATIEHNKHNTLTWEILQSFNDIINDVESNAELKGLIITGSEKYFCCGFNIPMLLKITTREEIIRFLAHSDGTLIKLFSCKKPVIACLNGSAIAAGLILAMCCDYRIAAMNAKARYGLSEIKLGLSLSLVHTEILGFGMDVHDMRDLACFGTLLDVGQAQQKRIIDEITDNPLARAKQIINDWMGNPGDPFMHIKETIRHAIVKKIGKRLAEETGKENLNIIHNAKVRSVLEEISCKMK